jgi:Nucleotidyl transferase AbiEii toxin, Type IV TA system
MLDLYDELTILLAAIDRAEIEYALCGGLAMAVWQLPRATVDIDLLIEESSLAPIEEVAATLGYVIKARPMNLAGGAMKIRRISKIDPGGGDVLMLDLLLVTPALQDVWEQRVRVEWERGEISVVSREGLIKLKTFRSSGRDLDDIEFLKDQG